MLDFEILTVSEKASAGHVNVYPNPASDIVYIDLPENIISVRIFNINGVLVWQTVPGKSVSEINVKDFSSGMYMIKVLTSKESIITKFVKP
ncbi:MAG: T9SS type A sorting domain-containing protein [Proteobacteria bacterium]|nr:T9SS type A sorting domain-containing protein [Pseudomonadota bacterium]